MNKAEANKETKCLRAAGYSIPQGAVHIKIMDNNTLSGRHECDLDMYTQSAPTMEFFRPSHDLSILACTNCHFRVEFLGLPRENFDKHFLEIEEFLNRRMRVFWDEEEQPNNHNAMLIYTIRIKEEPIDVFSPVVKAWHCVNDKDIRFKGNGLVKMTFCVYNYTHAFLHCPACGYSVNFRWDVPMSFEKVFANLRDAFEK